MPQVQFSLNIGTTEFEKYYRGHAKNVFVTASNGLKVQFPANLLTKHITHYGIHGLFVLQYDVNGKAQSLTKV